METIISEIAQKYINKLLERISAGGTLDQLTAAFHLDANDCAAKMARVYAEKVDAEIVGDKVYRRQEGYTVERRGDERRQQTLVGEVAYRRTYFKKAAGGYEYLTDTILGVEKWERLNESLSLALVKAAKDMSYGKVSTHLTAGGISRQTVMGKIRQSYAQKPPPWELRRVPELHIDADEAHITLRGGRRSEVPLISVYEGITRQGKRNECKNIFHISEYGKSADDLWEQALTEIESRYDLRDTKIYLHGDGGNWIQKGLEWFPDAIFVLDKYHKNQALKIMTAGLSITGRRLFDAGLREALKQERKEVFDHITVRLCYALPERIDKIIDNANYLKRFIKGISICAKDQSANNGGCAEPHVSHVLSARLSSRPMAWSKKTLVRFAPMLAGGKVCKAAPFNEESLPVPLRKAAASARKAFRRETAGLPAPDAIGTLPLSGKITGTQKILHMFA